MSAVHHCGPPVLWDSPCVHGSTIHSTYTVHTQVSKGITITRFKWNSSIQNPSVRVRACCPDHPPGGPSLGVLHRDSGLQRAPGPGERGAAGVLCYSWSLLGLPQGTSRVRARSGAGSWGRDGAQQGALPCGDLGLHRDPVLGLGVDRWQIQIRDHWWDSPSLPMVPK